MKFIKFCVGCLLGIILSIIIIRIGFTIGLYFRIQRELKETQKLYEIYQEIENIPLQEGFISNPTFLD